MGHHACTESMTKELFDFKQVKKGLGKGISFVLRYSISLPAEIGRSFRLPSP